MQKLLGSTLSTAEKRGIAKWLPRTLPCSTNDETGGMMLVEQLKKEQSGKRKAPDDGHEVRENNVVEDHVLDHVIGSVAEVEHLCSIANHILMEKRAAKAPILFEAILFLRINRELWTEFTVIDAWNAVWAELKDERLKQKLEVFAGDDDDDDGAVQKERE